MAGEELKVDDYSFALESFFKKLRFSYGWASMSYILIASLGTLIITYYANPPDMVLAGLLWFFPGTPIGLFIFLFGMRVIRNRAVATLKLVHELISPNAWTRATRLLKLAFKSKVQLVIPFFLALGGFIFQAIGTGLVRGFEKYNMPESDWLVSASYNPSWYPVNAWYATIGTAVNFAILGMIFHIVVVNAVIVRVTGRGALPEKVNIWHPGRGFGFSAVGSYAFAIAAVWLLGGASFLFALVVAPFTWWVVAPTVVFIVFAVIIFLVPLLSYRSMILGVKSRRLKELSEYKESSYHVFLSALKKLKEQDNIETIAKVDKLNGAINSLDAEAERVRKSSPWPIDLNTWKNFLVSILISLAPILIARLLPLLGLGS